MIAASAGSVQQEAGDPFDHRPERPRPGRRRLAEPVRQRLEHPADALSCLVEVRRPEDLVAQELEDEGVNLRANRLHHVEREQVAGLEVALEDAGPWGSEPTPNSRA